MNSKIKTLAIGIVAAMALFVSNTAMRASEPEKANYTKASYDAAELKRNLKSGMLQVKADPAERVTFTVSVDKSGDVKDLTYTHNITTAKQEVVDAQIQKAYAAIMSTSFFPAKKDGQTVEDTLSITFEMVN